MKKPDIKTQIKQQGGIKAFCEFWEIPYRTVQDWHTGMRRPPPWLPGLIAEALQWRQRNPDHKP